MTEPVSFTRLYEHGLGIEHPASPEAIKNVIASMNSTEGLNPFKVRLRFGDGSVVVVGPKKGPRAK